MAAVHSSCNERSLFFGEPLTPYNINDDSTDSGATRARVIAYCALDRFEDAASLQIRLLSPQTLH